MVFEEIINEASLGDQLLVEPDKRFNESIRLLKVSARSVILDEASKIDNMIQDIVKGEEGVFLSMFR